MKRVMVDIETMSTHTSEALILSVAAVSFSLDSKSALISPNSFLEVLDMNEQIIAGRLIDPKTQHWWRHQSSEARAHWASTDITRISMSVFCKLFTDYLRSVGDYDQVEIWANGIAFDVSNLAHVFNSIGLQEPWKYNLVRDSRTIYQLPELRTSSGPKNPIKHDPLADCVVQISRLWNHLPMEMMTDGETT